MKKQGVYFIASTIIVLTVVYVGIFTSSEPKETGNLLTSDGEKVFDLMAHWSQGNIVTLTRHAERCDKSNNACLDGEKGITVPGKEMAVNLGNDFKALLDLDDTEIYNSPSKRTSQTAEFMFGNASIDKQWLLDDCKGNLLQTIFENKEEGKNMVLITHSSCIKNLSELGDGKLSGAGAENQETYGITVFFAVDKHEKQAYVLGLLYPDDWAKAMNYKRIPAGWEMTPQIQ